MWYKHYALSIPSKKRTIKRNRSEGRNYLLPSRRRQKGARTRLWVTSVIKPLKTSGSHVARQTTCVAKDPWTSDGWTSRCLSRSSTGARSGTGGRRLKDFSTLATASRTFAYSLSAKRAAKYALDCFFETGNFSLSVQAMALKVGAFSCPDRLAAVASCSAMARASYLSKSSSLLNPYWVILDRRAGTSERLPASSRDLILAVSCARRSS